jgi:hypothetical protein
LEAAANIISQDTTKKFEKMLGQFSVISDTIQGAIHTRFDGLEIKLKSTNSIDRGEDVDVEKEINSQPQTNKTRLSIAETVRATVLAKWQEGRTFRKTEEDANCFTFKSAAQAGVTYEIYLRTPYRRSLGSDKSLPYTLEIWADGYKKLNFEWDTDGNYALRGFKRGDWVEDISLWQFGPLNASEAATLAA